MVSGRWDHLKTLSKGPGSRCELLNLKSEGGACTALPQWAFSSVHLMLQLAVASSPETDVLLMPRGAGNGHMCLCIQMGTADPRPGEKNRSRHCSSLVRGPWHWLVCPVGERRGLHSPRAPGNRDYLTLHCCPLYSNHQAGHCFLPSLPCQGTLC